MNRGRREAGVAQDTAQKPASGLRPRGRAPGSARGGQAQWGLCRAAGLRAPAGCAPPPGGCRVQPQLRGVRPGRAPLKEGGSLLASLPGRSAKPSMAPGLGLRTSPQLCGRGSRGEKALPAPLQGSPPWSPPDWGGAAPLCGPAGLQPAFPQSHARWLSTRRGPGRFQTAGLEKGDLGLQSRNHPTLPVHPPLPARSLGARSPPRG